MLSRRNTTHAALALVLLSSFAWAQARRAVVEIDMRGPARAGWFDPKTEVVGLRGAVAPLSWASTLRAEDPDGDLIYAVEADLPHGALVEAKIKVDGVGNPNDGWEGGQNRRLRAGAGPVRLAPEFPGPPKPSVAGRLEIHRAFGSRFVVARTVRVLLPPGYSAHRNRRYPVVYMHDGQNLFDGATSFVAGGEWRVDETMRRLTGTGAVEPVIVVGIDNAGPLRIDEYTHVRSSGAMGTRSFDGGGKADLYGRFVVEELKPFIDRVYRTRPELDATGLGGSSLGGLVTMYLGLKYPRVFGKLIVASPSVWWADEAILSSVRSLPGPTGQRIWVDIGTEEGEQAVTGARKLRDALVERGWREGVDLRFVEERGARHDEAAWAGRFDEVMEFLYPAR